eukprot:1826994-Amphidinium_carterae.2
MLWQAGSRRKGYTTQQGCNQADAAMFTPGTDSRRESFRFSGSVEDCSTSRQGWGSLAWFILGGDDLKQALLSLLKNAKAQAMAVVTCVGSLRTVHLRLAGASATSSGKTLNLEGRYEVVSLVGTIGSGFGYKSSRPVL